LAGTTKAFFTSLKIIPENDNRFWLDYSTTHLQEHQTFAQAVTSALLSYGINRDYQPTLTTTIDPQDKAQTSLFFEQNYNDHMMFYSLLNQLGGVAPNPSYTYPYLYAGNIMDISLEKFLYTEKVIHNIMFAALNTSLGLT
jgi:hypothetical protein